MNFVRNLIAEPWRFDYFALLRQLERTFTDGPRIGDSAALREEFARFGQDPFMEFPASNVARVEAGRQRAAENFRQTPRPARAAGRPAIGGH